MGRADAGSFVEQETKGQWLEQAPPPVVTFASWTGQGNGWLPLKLGCLPAPGFLRLSLNVLVWFLKCFVCYMSHSPIKIKVAEDKEWKGKQENYVEGTRQVSIYVAGMPYSKKRQPKISIYHISIV